MVRFINGIICGRDKLISGHDLLIRQDRVSLEKKSTRAAEKTIDLAGSYVLPAFTEIHTHGASLFEFTAGRDTIRKQTLSRAAPRSIRKNCPAMSVYGLLLELPISTWEPGQRR